MHISRTDLNLLIVFDAIYTQGGVSHAAKALNLSQPTISHALARLRAQVGDPLFVRAGQKLLPTPAARKMIAPIRRGLQTIETAMADLHGFDPANAQRTFTIGIHALMEHTFFRPLVSSLQTSAPRVSISSTQFERRTLETDLSSGILDAAIDVFLPLPESICRQKITSEKVVVICRAGHSALNKQGKISLETYLRLDHILVSTRRQGLGPEDTALARIGKSRKISMRCQQINTAMHAVATTDLILTTATTFALAANEPYTNTIIAVPFETSPIDTYLYWHSNSDMDKANVWLRKHIQQVCAHIPKN